MIQAIFTTNPKGLHVYNKIKMSDDATPSGSYMLTKNFFYKHSNPSDCILHLLNQLKEAVK
jgi:hypothetical protein